MTWKDDAPLMYVCIVVFTVVLSFVFCVMFNKTHVLKWLCCASTTYTRVAEADDAPGETELTSKPFSDEPEPPPDAFVIDDDEVEVDLAMMNPAASTKMPEDTEAGTV